MFQKKKVGYRQESYESEDGALQSDNPSPALPETVQLESSIQPHRGTLGGSREKLSPEGTATIDHRCFTTRCALVTTFAAFLVTTALVLILDLGISGSEILGRRHAYGNPIEVDKNVTLVTFTLRGSPSDYVNFEKIPWADKRLVYSVEMEYVDIDISDFDATFEFGAENLKTVTLRNVRFHGELKFSRLWEKSLESFHIEYNEPIGREANFSLDGCDHCVTTNSSNRSTTGDISALMKRKCIDLLILLYRPDRYELSGNLADMGYNYSLSIMGSRLVAVDNVAGEVTSMLPYSDELVRNTTMNSSKFSSGLRHLRLRDTKLNVTTLAALSSSLVSLQLDNVELVGLQAGQSVSQVLSSFSSLEELSLKFGPFLDNPRQVVAPHATTILLDDLPSSLKSLTLAHVQLQLNPGSRANFHLDNLTVYHSEVMSDEILANFSRHFQVDRIAWQVEGVRGPVKMKNNWIEVLEKLSGGNPSWIFLDNSVIGPFLKTGAGPLPPAGYILTLPASNPVFLMSNAVNATYTRPPGAKVQVSLSPEETPRARWFELLRMETFLEKRLLFVKDW